MEHYKLKNLFYGTMLLSSARQHQIVDPQFTDKQDGGTSVWKKGMMFVCGYHGSSCDKAFSHEPILNLVEIYV